LLYLFFAGAVAANCVAEQHLCMSAAFDRGICNHRGMTVALKALLHGALAVLGVATAAVWIAPSGKPRMLSAALAVLMLAAGCFGYAGNARSLFVAALADAAVAATVILPFLRRRAPAA
jgi:hypothetical protein